VYLLAFQTVHTTGVNLQGVLSTAAAVTILVTPLGLFMARTIKRSVKDEIDDVVEAAIKREVTPKVEEIRAILRDAQGTLNEHSVEIAYLKGVQQGKEQVIGQAKLSS
jgi:hypothetical protein